ncbi:MAG: hypothetical protein AB8F78_05990 [Saprospiraceae bacterium]
MRFKSVFLFILSFLLSAAAFSQYNYERFDLGEGIAAEMDLVGLTDGIDDTYLAYGNLVFEDGERDAFVTLYNDNHEEQWTYRFGGQRNVETVKQVYSEGNSYRILIETLVYDPEIVVGSREMNILILSQTGDLEEQIDVSEVVDYIGFAELQYSSSNFGGSRYLFQRIRNDSLQIFRFEMASGQLAKIESYRLRSSNIELAETEEGDLYLTDVIGVHQFDVVAERFNTVFDLQVLGYDDAFFIHNEGFVTNDLVASAGSGATLVLEDFKGMRNIVFDDFLGGLSGPVASLLANDRIRIASYERRSVLVDINLATSQIEQTVEDFDGPRVFISSFPQDLVPPIVNEDSVLPFVLGDSRRSIFGAYGLLQDDTVTVLKSDYDELYAKDVFFTPVRSGLLIERRLDGVVSDYFREDSVFSIIGTDLRIQDSIDVGFLEDYFYNFVISSPQSVPGGMSDFVFIRIGRGNTQIVQFIRASTGEILYEDDGSANFNSTYYSEVGIMSAVRTSSNSSTLHFQNPLSGEEWSAIIESDSSMLVNEMYYDQAAQQFYVFYSEISQSQVSSTFCNSYDLNGQLKFSSLVEDNVSSLEGVRPLSQTYFLPRNDGAVNIVETKSYPADSLQKDSTKVSWFTVGQQGDVLSSQSTWFLGDDASFLSSPLSITSDSIFFISRESSLGESLLSVKRDPQELKTLFFASASDFGNSQEWYGDLYYMDGAPTLFSAFLRDASYSSYSRATKVFDANSSATSDFPSSSSDCIALLGNPIQGRQIRFLNSCDTETSNLRLLNMFGQVMPSTSSYNSATKEFALTANISLASGYYVLQHDSVSEMVLVQGE